MNYQEVPIIVISCYLIGEIYKLIFKEKTYKFIPVILTILGGLINLIIFFSSNQIIDTSSVIKTIEIGFVSGASATGTNQIIKQIFHDK